MNSLKIPFGSMNKCYGNLPINSIKHDETLNVNAIITNRIVPRLALLKPITELGKKYDFAERKTQPMTLATMKSFPKRLHVEFMLVSGDLQNYLTP